jgi:hypothetical protein
LRAIPPEKVTRPGPSSRPGSTDASTTGAVTPAPPALLRRDRVFPGKEIQTMFELIGTYLVFTAVLVVYGAQV